MKASKWIIIGAAVALPQLASAADEAPVCTSTGTVPPDLGAWIMQGTTSAVATADALPSARLVIGQAVQVKLLKTPLVGYLLQPQRPGSADSYGGMMQLFVNERGTYRVVLGSKAWIDLVSPRGTAVESVAHTMGPACTGIRKIVDFALEPGAYTLQIAGNGGPATIILVTRKP